MLLIAGLGNPGDKYARHRHNIGFMAVDAIAGRHGFSAYKRKFSALVAEGTIAGERALIIKPQDYMNLSGPPIAEAANFYKIPLDKVLVIHDELDLAAGKVRVKTGGSTAGHNGLRSIDAHLGPGYRRLRLGIGHPGEKNRVSGHVLGPFAEADRDWVDPLLTTLADNIALLLAGEDSTFLNKLVAATAPPPAADDAGARKAEPPGQSHIRQARRSPPKAEIPHDGALAAMLKKLFNRG